MNPSSSFLDLSHLESLREFCTAGDPDPVVELIELYLELAPGRYDRILRAKELNDFQALRREIHSLKGSVGNFGCKTLYDLCVAAEKALGEPGERPQASTEESSGPIVDQILSLSKDLEGALKERKDALLRFIP